MNSSLRVLIVEDSDTDLAALVRTLRRGGYEPEWVQATSAWATRQALLDKEWDVIITDYTMPYFSGPEVLQLVQEAEPEIPAIIVSRTIDEDVAVMCLHMGAVDYVMKHNLERLVPAVQRALREAEDRKSRKATEAALRASEERYRELVENASDVVFTIDLKGDFTSLNRAGEEISGYLRSELTRMNMSDVLTADGLRTAQAMMAQKLTENRPTRYELELIGRDGRHVPLEVSTTLIEHDGAPVGVQGIARDITERKRAEEELRSRERKQAVVARLGQEALGTDNLNAVFQSAMESVTQTLELDQASILEVVPSGNRLFGRAGIGWGPGVIGSATVESGSGSQAGYALLTNQAVIMDDIYTETRFSIPSILIEHGIRCGMSVIIHGQHRPFGVLSAFSQKQGSFSRDDTLFMQAVANVLGTAIERMRLEAERERQARLLASRILQAQEEERKRIARELHDETAQTLSVLLAQLDLLEDYIPVQEGELRRGFDRLGDLARRALDETRALSHDLRPTILDDVGLVAAVEWLAEEYEKAHGTAVTFVVESEPPSGMTPEIEVAVFRIAQEALTNCGRHSGASKVCASLAFAEADVRLVIEDNGRGFDVDRVRRPTREGRLGLYGMRERTALLGGTLSIDTSPGMGARVTLEIPIPPAAQEVMAGSDHATALV